MGPESKTNTSKPVRLPLLPVAVAGVCGIVCGKHLPLPTTLWAIAGAMSMCLSIVFFIRPHLRPVANIALLISIACLAAVHLRVHYYTVDEKHISTYTPHQPILATLRGRIVSAPQIRDGSNVQGYRLSPRTVFLVRASEIATGDSWTQTQGLVRITVREPAKQLHPGQVVELVGKIGRFPSPDNPGQTDWSEFARQTGVFVWMSVPLEIGATVIKDNPSWTSRTLWRLRAGARQHLQTCGDSNEGHLLNALILGERDPALRSLNHAMASAGIAHFLSISGLHMGIFLGFVYLLCRLFLLRPRRAAMIVLLVLGAYVLLAEPRAPLLRSAVMAAMLCLSVLTHRQYAALNALAASAIILLAADPLQLFQPGFQLSYVIVAGLLILHESIRQLLFGRWLRRRGLMVFRNDQRIRRWLWYTGGNWTTSAVAMAVGAWVVAFPLLAVHFGLLTPYAPLLSLLVFPIVLLVLIPGYLSIALMGVLPGLASSLQQCATGSALWLGRAVQWTQHLPGLSITLRPVNPWWAVLCYVTIVAILFRERFRLGRVASVTCLVLTVAVGIWTQRPADASPSSELHLLSIGSGQCAILRTPSGQTWLFDAGSQSGYDINQEVLGPFLRHNRFANPVGAFVSHGNTDHFNAIPSLLQQSRLDRVYLNSFFGKGKQAGSAEVEMLRLLSASGCKIRRVATGETVMLDDSTKIEVLRPAARLADNTCDNDRSLVLRVDCGGRTILFPGDLDLKGQEQLLQSDTRLNADILILPHHGAWQRTLPEFIDRVNPEVVLVSSATDPQERYAWDDDSSPRKRFYKTLPQKRRYYSTARDGWIRVNLTPKTKMRVETGKQH